MYCVRCFCVIIVLFCCCREFGMRCKELHKNKRISMNSSYFSKRENPKKNWTKVQCVSNCYLRFEESHLIWDLYFFFLIQFHCKIFQPKHVFILLLLAKITYIFRSQEAFSWVEFNPVFHAPLIDNFLRLFEETHYVTVEPLDQD